MAGRKQTHNKVVLANISVFDSEATKTYAIRAPHLKHTKLKMLNSQLIGNVFEFAKQHTKNPKVLDLGAGEGSVTLLFLELGAKVVAVDVSSSQLDALRSKCEMYSDMLEVRCEDINVTLANKSEKYDIIVSSSLLHHVPDYLEMISKAIIMLSLHGQYFSFQDPLRYDTVNKFTLLFSKLAYFSWRVFQSDAIGGLKRWLRRTRGIFLDDSVSDITEFHVIRNGVDQDTICRLFKAHAIECEIVSYFSTQSRFFQTLGTLLGIKNHFSAVARKGTD